MHMYVMYMYIYMSDSHKTKHNNGNGNGNDCGTGKDKMAKYSNKQNEANKEATNHQQFDMPRLCSHTHICTVWAPEWNFWELLLTHL